MSMYSQIQTYVKCNKENFISEITRFKSLLAQIGFGEKYIADSFFDIKWDVCDNGFVYSLDNAKPVNIDLFGKLIKIWPSVLGWTPQIMKEIKEPWLEVEVVFQMDDIIKDYHTFEFKDEVKTPLWSIMMLFSKYYRETGIFLTDECTDGRPWEALLGCSRDYWLFDAAIIPAKIARHYRRRPADFIGKKADTSLFLIDKRAWGETPW